MPNNFTLSSIGTRGLVIYDEDAGGYRYVEESKWRARGSLSAAPPAMRAADLSALKVVVAALDNGAYVDFDHLPDLDQPSDNTVGGTVAWANTRSVVIRENDTLYQVPEEAWSQVPAGFEGDAGVLVNRGTVVAAIPSNSIPSGTYCVLVNLTSLGR